MKTMTCKQLGGPCDYRLQGDTADAVIKAQDRHLRDMVAGGDDTHASALKEMKGRWKHPISGMGWYRAAKRDFADRPEDWSVLRAGHLGEPGCIRVAEAPQRGDASCNGKAGPFARVAHVQVVVIAHVFLLDDGARVVRFGLTHVPAGP